MNECATFILSAELLGHHIFQFSVTYLQSSRKCGKLLSLWNTQESHDNIDLRKKFDILENILKLGSARSVSQKNPLIYNTRETKGRTMQLAINQNCTASYNFPQIQIPKAYNI